MFVDECLKLIHRMVLAKKKKCFQATSNEDMEARTDLGLIKGHAYGITSVKRVPIGGTNLKTLFK